MNETVELLKKPEIVVRIHTRHVVSGGLEVINEALGMSNQLEVVINIL